MQAILSQRAADAGIEAIALSPRLGDFNEDLHVFGLDALRAALAVSARARGRRPLPAFVDGGRGIAPRSSIDVDRPVMARPIPEEDATTAF